jgi:hypothetical protein
MKEELMAARMFSGLIGFFLFSTFSTLVGQQANEDSKRYIMESERRWAELVATGDTRAAERILADDFVGVDPEGNFYYKAKMIADTPHRSQAFHFQSARNTEARSLRLDRYLDSPKWQMADRGC